MKRPWQVWTVFGACLAVAVAGMTWLSYRVSELERAEAQRNLSADFESNVRLALGRMDLVVSQLLAGQNALPYLAYEPAYRPPSVGQQPGRLIPSPLRTPVAPVKLYFQLSPGHELRSPSVPNDSASKDSGPDSGLTVSDPEELARRRRLLKLRQILDRPRLLAQLPEPKPLAGENESLAAENLAAVEPAPRLANDENQQPADQQARNAQEYNTRVKGFQSQIGNAAVQIQQRDQINGLDPQWAGGTIRPTPMRPATVIEGLSRPVWLNGELVLAREVKVDDRIVLQGCWIDWPALKRELAAEVADLLPRVDLAPVADQRTADPGRMLATLSAQLVVAPPTIDGRFASQMSPVRMALLAAWIALALAALAAALLLRGVLVLSERRAAFVSAVTHELRTPLTTFRMYSEMLSEGMVPEESQRRQYFTTLRTEADRLFHLIENVLSYARLERGPHKTAQSPIVVADLLHPLISRLSDRAARDDMNIEVDLDESAGSATLSTDPAAFEQIMVNLVDNACKYAAAAADRRIHLAVRRDGPSLLVRVWDHGPGIAANDARRLFRPFTKSAQDAARSAPGVGLGLALSRGLARDLGGSLVLESNARAQEPVGASFVLRLPIRADLNPL